MQQTNEGMIILNPDALQSQLLQDYMAGEGTDVLDVIESLKDAEFIHKHAYVNKELSSFEFPNLKN